MADNLASRVELIRANLLPSLSDIGRGIEKEGLRVDQSGFIAHTEHPEALGKALTHGQITTDYSEALLELITPVYHSSGSVIHQLEDIHTFVQKQLQSEVLWAGSMPCRLAGDNSIPIAEYGNSHLGKLKNVYRQGLSVRYGRMMQSIAGMHYNFSLPDSFWTGWQAVLGDEKPLKDFKSEQYFSLIRNFRRHSWLIMYLFGASPALDASFVEGKPHNLQAHLKNTLMLPYATSLRMGDLGYHNNAQASLGICFNKLENFLATLTEAIHTPYPKYEAIGTQKDGKYIQLNTNILQIENEYYSSIRPKRTIQRGETPIHALQEKGVEYIEVRCMDLNPFLPAGVSQTEIDFLDMFLLFCLVDDSPWIDDSECAEVENNFSMTVNKGRDPALELSHHGTKRSLSDSAKLIMDKISPIMALMNSTTPSNDYQKSWNTQYNKITSPDLTPSAHVLDVLNSENLEYNQFIMELSKKHQEMFLSRPLSKIHEHSFTKMREESFLEEQRLRASDSGNFSDYLTQYLS